MKKTQMFEAVRIVKHMPIASIIRTRREKCGMSLREVAKLTDISPSYLCKMENGQITTYVSDGVARKINEVIG